MPNRDLTNLLGRAAGFVAEQITEEEQSVLTPSSSAITRIEYDVGLENLTVTFAKGGSWTYRGVNKITYQAFALASSKGRFFNNRIKGNYSYSRG